MSSALISAEQHDLQPLITKSKIEDIALKCDAKVTLSDMPSYDEDGINDQAKTMLFVGVERSNSPEAIACVQDNIPSIVLGMVGREKGVPPLDQQILNGILKTCGWQDSDGFVGFVGDVLQFQPNPETEYELVDCVFSGIKPYHPTKFGFIGNEAYAQEKQE